MALRAILTMKKIQPSERVGNACAGFVSMHVEPDRDNDHWRNKPDSRVLSLLFERGAFWRTMNWMMSRNRKN
jgi:hypothetical protein